MAASFFFYDLETSGLDPRSARIMQFAGQRTDLELKPIGEAVNVLIKLTPDVLPSPEAIMLTGITPQQTLAEGLSEAQFLKLFYKEVVKRGTIFVGFNNVRFDDEFMRYLHWRNFYDPYEWLWKDDCSRWDILDLVRMTRALRPAGIQWPVTEDGKPTNRLELLTSLNGLEHSSAHEALSDVMATIAVAQLVRDCQPELFKYLLETRSKKAVAKLVEKGQPFVYSSGRYPSQNLNTTVAILLASHPQPTSALVYDLRHDPTPFMKMSVSQLTEAWRFTKLPSTKLPVTAQPGTARLPVKTVKFNRCPAIAPLGVLKEPSAQTNIQLDLQTVAKHLALLTAGQPEFASKVLKALSKLDEERANRQQLVSLSADGRLYDKFVSDADKQVMQTIRSYEPDAINSIAPKLKDERLQELLPLYKARNFSSSLNSAERRIWEDHCRQQLFEGGDNSKLAAYFAVLESLANPAMDPNKAYLLEELQLYGQSILPVDLND